MQQHEYEIGVTWFGLGVWKL